MLRGIYGIAPMVVFQFLAQPTAIHRVPEPQRSLSELRGTLPGVSGELSSADYVRQLRTGEHRG